MRVPAAVSVSLLYRALALAGGASVLAVAASACGSNGNGLSFANSDDAGGPSSSTGTVNLEDGGFSLDALAAADPPNQWCGPDGSAPPAPPEDYGMIEWDADRCWW